MTETRKNKSEVYYPLKTTTTLSDKEIKVKLLNAFLRKFSTLSNGKVNESLKIEEIKAISSITNIPPPLVKRNVNKFLYDLKLINEFYRDYNMKWEHEPKKLNRKIRIHLHRIHRFAPVFNYDRARKNLEILHLLLKKKLFWPQINTQIAIVIYVTDKNDKNYQDNERIIQKNIRMLCSCSEYAFHRTRNMLDID